MKKQQQDLENKLQDPAVWADQKLASELGQQVREIKDTISLFESWDTIIEDAQTALENSINNNFVCFRNRMFITYYCNSNLT